MQSTDWAPKHSDALREYLARGMSYSEIADAIAEVPRFTDSQENIQEAQAADSASDIGTHEDSLQRFPVRQEIIVFPGQRPREHH